MNVFEKHRGGQIAFHCLGCDEMHYIPVDPRLKNAWLFNGDFIKPTLKPSILVKAKYIDQKPTRICHSFITDGKIKYLDDCTHDLKGQTVDLPVLKL